MSVRSMTESESPSKLPSALLAQASWLCALARGLVADAALADDLAQQTALAALRARPGAEISLRGWLATVLRNMLRQTRRAALRRERREHAAAAGESAPDTAEVVQRFHEQRRVAAAVARLAEPYRSTILLRYFEECSAAEIARRLGVPASTVRNRIARGLALLREALDRAHGGDGRSWALALVPLIPLPVPAGAAAVAALGVLFVKLKLALLLVIVAFAGTSLWLWSGSAPRPAATAGGPPAASAGSGAPREPEGLAESAAVERVAAREPAEARPPAAGPARAGSAPPAPAAAPAGAVVTGIVLDASGRPAANVRLAVADKNREPPVAAVTAVSDAAGNFTLDAPDRSGFLVAAEPDVATVFAARVDAGKGGAATVIVAPALSLAGSTVAPDGSGVGGARVGVQLPSGFRARFTAVLDQSLGSEWRGESAADGRFELARVPAIAGATLFAEAAGFAPAAEPVPDHSHANLVLRLGVRERADAEIRGVVVEPSGARVEGALVALRGETTETGPDGEFTIAADDDAWVVRLASQFGEPEADVRRQLAGMGLGMQSPLAARLLAVKQGFLPAVLELESFADGAGFPSFVVLRLGDGARSLAGTVLDPNGAPLPGAVVWIEAPTFAGMSDNGGPLFLENVLAGETDRAWRTVAVDSEGRFEIGGLLAQDYVLGAMDPATLLRTRAGAVAAGRDDVVLRLPTGAVHSDVDGRVVSRSGDPVADANVYAMCDAFQIQGSTSHAAGDPVETDAEGRFHLRNVPKAGVYVRVDGNGIVPLEFGRAKPRLEDATGGPVRDLVITVELRCHVRVELADPARADRFAMQDAEGVALPIDLADATGRRTMMNAPIENGASAVVAASDRAAFIVLFRGDTEVERRPIALEPGEVTIVEG